MRSSHLSVLRPWLINEKVRPQIRYCEGLRVISRVEESEESSVRTCQAFVKLEDPLDPQLEVSML